MKKFVGICIVIIIETLNNIRYFITSNLRNFVWLVNFLLPYAMYLIGQYVCLDRGKLAFGGELFIPLLICIISYFIKSYANKIGKGTDIPVPSKRFTSEDEWGEVSINQDRVQELILYMGDLEDWLERKGLL